LSTDDLNTPLGVEPKKKKRFVLPVALVTRGVAGLLGLCVAVFAGWILFVDEPFGGEPMVVVSADTRPAAPVPKGDEPAAAASAPASTAQKPEAVALPAASAGRDKAAPAGAQTITIIDGSTGKRQEVTVAPQSGKGDTKIEPRSIVTPGSAIEQRLLESSRHGAIPKIAPDGTRPSDAYARPIKPQAGRADAPRIAIIVQGLGIGANGTSEAISKLPAAVTFAFTPYGTDLERWVSRARGEGHEILLQVGMEPLDYPDSDPGPQTLLTSLPGDANVDRLQWSMSRFQGYVGIASLMGARFTATEQAIAPVLREVGKRGLIFFEDGTSPRSAAGQVAGANNVAFAKADAMLDAVPTATEIDLALARLEATARSRGIAIGAASALPISIDRIAQWARGAEDRGIILVPLSAVASRAKTAT